MSSVNESISRVRELLNYPHENTPQLHRIYGAVLRHLQNRVNELNNTGQAWAFSSENVTVADGTDVYSLTATNFGKPLGVVTYSTNDAHFQRQIPFATMQNLIFDWDAPRNIADGYWSLDGSTNSAQKIAFYRDAGTNTVKVKFLPIPQAAATYTVYYSIGDLTDDAALTLTPLLSEHHSLIEIGAALSLLPSSKWSQDEDANDRMRKNLAQALSMEMQLYTPTWERYVSEQVHSHINMRETAYDF